LCLAWVIRGLLQGGVGLLAHLLDLGAALGVRGQGWGRDGVGEGEEGAVQGVEVGEGGGEGGVGWDGGAANSFAGGVHVKGEEGECLVHDGGKGEERWGWEEVVEMGLTGRWIAVASWCWFDKTEARTCLCQEQILR
jgi:hypothetical protein